MKNADAQKKNDRTWWFWVLINTIAVKKKHAEKDSAVGEVWENLVIIQAKSPQHAYQKAVAIGKFDEGDCRGSLTLNGKPAITKFLGIRNMGLLHEGLEDGSEITYWQRFQTQKKARLQIRNKKELLDGVKKEMRWRK